MRKNTGGNYLAKDNVYHVITRSIAHYQIFNTDDDYTRMVQLLRFYQVQSPPLSYSIFLRQKSIQILGFDTYFHQVIKDYKKLVEIIAYCFMPNHIHLVLKQLQENGISIFMSNILNSYTRYFNLLHKRKGPLWESRFKHILIDKDEQLLHLTRYVHLNPSSAKLVRKPELWKYSSYLDYIKYRDNQIICYKDLLEIDPKSYQKFVNDRKDYQKQLSIIKKIIDI